MKAKRIKAVYGRTADGPALMLPATSEAYDAMVEQMSKEIACIKSAFVWKALFDSEKYRYRQDAHAALRAIGITRPKETKS